MEVLRQSESEPGTTKWVFWCPGCKCGHFFRALEPGNDPAAHQPVWEFNGNMERPTVGPSVMTTMGPEKEGEPNRVCHLFITDGSLHFLGECWHGLKDQVVGMTPVSDW